MTQLGKSQVKPEQSGCGKRRWVPHVSRTEPLLLFFHSRKGHESRCGAQGAAGARPSGGTGAKREVSHSPAPSSLPGRFPEEDADGSAGGSVFGRDLVLCGRSRDDVCRVRTSPAVTLQSCCRCSHSGVLLSRAAHAETSQPRSEQATLGFRRLSIPSKTPVTALLADRAESFQLR
ncbi:hypothetical protein AV530_004502 [Patagioenas fasciata monilis]|uniref:Uncharacterized protein n=1 Tax=Patagioenas fasciata monilis TaxID=372326 RepID=A0A1V4JC96_PATFA|nr:hypothetical protein AV530_004502 [Patagioenas fasciata monilis]